MPYAEEPENNLRGFEVEAGLATFCDANAVSAYEIFSDKWYGNELHYTGMGRNGDQTIDGNQNKTLLESDHNGVEIHLFEVFEPTKYTYQGIVKLSNKPYQEIQNGEDEHPRKVWMFP